jgi:uncharacterized membrane protein YiaA
MGQSTVVTRCVVIVNDKTTTDKYKKDEKTLTKVTFQIRLMAITLLKLNVYNTSTFLKELLSLFI